MKALRAILFPLAIVYGVITSIRRWLYNNGILKRTSFDLPIICVGNLSVGGTGKTPMVDYLISRYRHKKKVAVLSRGYGRSTQGYQVVTSQSDAIAAGDEPLQYKVKHGDQITVVVCESRVEGVQRLQKDFPDVNLIILDDAYQHMAIRAGYNILLTPHSRPYWKDLMLPTGDLRETSRGDARAQAIVTTKVPAGTPTADLRLAPVNRRNANAVLAASKIIYGQPTDMLGNTRDWSEYNTEEVDVITGIAKPEPFIRFLNECGVRVRHHKYADHHDFTDQELALFKEMRRILCTEKDAMRIRSIDLPQLCYVPITIDFIAGGGELLNSLDTFVD